MERPLSPPPTEEFRDLYPHLSQWLQYLPTLIPRISKYSSTLVIASIAANTVTRQTFTVLGIGISDTIFINPPPLPAGIEMLASYRVSANNTIIIPFWNSTGGAINPAPSAFTIWAFR